MRKLFYKSPLNYTGGKYKLLPQIMPLFPRRITTFVDLFCGGSNVGINITADNIIYNDYEECLINLFRLFDKYQIDTMIKEIDAIINKYKLSDSDKNGYAFYGCNSGEGLGKYNKEFFLSLRNDFNSKVTKDESYYLMLYVLIIYGFNNQLRFNTAGEYNLPVGKRDFNKNLKKHLIRFVQRLHSQHKEFINSDFRHLDLSFLDSDSFVYCDPPYLITTASYNEKKGWTQKDELDLLDLLTSLHKAGIKFALSNVTTHKGRVNESLIKWAEKFNTHFLEFNYNNSSYHSANTDKVTQEVLITNY